MALRTWPRKIICWSWKHYPLQCPWLYYDQVKQELHCCHGSWTKLALNRHGSPIHKEGCPIRGMTIEDASYKPRRQA
jgi:hypothetical protein